MKTVCIHFYDEAAPSVAFDIENPVVTQEGNSYVVHERGVGLVAIAPVSGVRFIEVYDAADPDEL